MGIIYNENSIQTMDFGQACREKIGMYLTGSLDEALGLGLRELLFNSVDEKLQGFGTKITLTIDTKKQIYSCEDDARGIPVGMRSDGINSLVAALTMAHTGGKHNTEVYSGAVGINGMGSSIVSHTSEWLIAKVKRDGKIYEVSFKETDKGAIVDKDVKIIGETEETGTLITYKPSRKVYGDNKIDIKDLLTMVEQLSYFNTGMVFEVIIDGKVKTFCSKNGLADSLPTTNRIHENILSYIGESNETKVELALHWIKKGAVVRSFANNLEVPDGGAFITGFKTSLTKAFNNLAGTDFSGEIIRKYLNGVVSVRVKVPQFSNQAKTALANPEARTACAKAITEALGAFKMRYPQDFGKIVEVLYKEVKAEEAADRARAAIMDTQIRINAFKKEKILAPGKLMDCEVHGEQASLYLTEGDSAAGSIGQARESKYTAVMPLRGKIINALKNSDEDVLKSDVVIDLIKALGCGILDRYKTKDLNYGKICIYTDADVDGSSIMCLLLTFFYKYIPQLIQEGKVYWARAPLFSVSEGENRYYAYNNEELEEILKKIKGKKEIKRNKGIGEMSPIDVNNTILNEDNGRFIQFTMENIEQSVEMFTMLMGEEVAPRKNYIFEKISFDSLVE